MSTKQWPLIDLNTELAMHYRTIFKWLFCLFCERLNRPFLSSLVPLFQNESKCETILMKMNLICMKMNLYRHP